MPHCQAQDRDRKVKLPGGMHLMGSPTSNRLSVEQSFNEMEDFPVLNLKTSKKSLVKVTESVSEKLRFET